MAGQDQKSTPLTSHDQLVRYIEQGCKPPEDWRIGTEHEKLGFHSDDYSPLPYEGERGIKALLQGLQDEFGWRPVLENGNLIALQDSNDAGGSSITLEPGGQFELSGAMLENLHQTCEEVHTHLAQVRAIGERLGIGFLGIGFSPKWTRAEIPKMPKQRYKTMTAYMPKRGSLGLDMMYRSCTVQVNLDFRSEADMVKKFRVGLALQPIATALCANSPFTEGKPNGFQSFRSEIWKDTDPDRTGMLAFVFEDGMSYERYVDYVLDVPMYFVYRNGVYHDVAGASFKDFMAGKLAALPGEVPTPDNWVDHMTTVFPEVRLKQFLEMRGADSSPWRGLCALPALWTGLLYDDAALDAAWDLVKDWSEIERQNLRDEVPRLGLRTPFRNANVLALAREVLAIARAGLKARNRCDKFGENEEHFLSALETIVDSGQSQSDILLAHFNGGWAGDINRIFTECAY